MRGRANQHKGLLSKVILAVVGEVDDLAVLDSERLSFFVKNISKLFSRASLAAEIDTKGR